MEDYAEFAVHKQSEQKLCCQHVCSDWIRKSIAIAIDVWPGGRAVEGEWGKCTLWIAFGADESLTFCEMNRDRQTDRQQDSRVNICVLVCVCVCLCVYESNKNSCQANCSRQMKEKKAEQAEKKWKLPCLRFIKYLKSGWKMAKWQRLGEHAPALVLFTPQYLLSAAAATAACGYSQSYSKCEGTTIYAQWHSTAHSVVSAAANVSVSVGSMMQLPCQGEE